MKRIFIFCAVLLATVTSFANGYVSPISVTDGTAADWDLLPAEYVATATHTDGCSLDGLKSVKVFCDETYLNLLVEVNLDVVTNLEYAGFNIFLNADNSAQTGGDALESFSDADSEWMLESVIYSGGAVNPYNPAVFKWWGAVGGSGWWWTDPEVESTFENCWGAIVCEGSDPAVGNAQMVDGDLGKVEIQLLKELIPAQWADEFTIGLVILQDWNDVGHLPNAADGTEVLAEKLKVKVYTSTLYQDGLYYDYTTYVEPYNTAAVIGADADIITATIPESIEIAGKTYPVTSIGEWAFSDCSSLTSITIPNSVTSIGEGTFYSCSSLISITIPNSVTSIGSDAFEDCSSLTSITIGNSVTSIGGEAFCNCTSLTSITIPNSVTSIEDLTFYQCSSLTSVTIGNSVTSIGGSAFVGCSSLTSMVVESGNSTYDSRENCNAIIETATNTLIAGCQNTIIPNSITSIGNSAFFYCSSLTSIAIPNSVTNVGSYAFYYCSSLSSITIPNSVTSIGKGTFEGCAQLEKLTLGTAVKDIAANAFAGCNRLYHIYCYPTNPPVADQSSFSNYNVYLHVPCDYKEEYDLDIFWGNFKHIECIDSEDVSTNGVVITPSTNDVTITWPTEDNANNYTIVIEKDGEVFCTLTFNAEGQLLNIAFAPGRDGNHLAQYAEQATNGYRFTVTGLEEATTYAYNITAKDASDKTIKSHSGEFTTQSNTSTDVDNLNRSVESAQKLLRNGQVYILQDGKTYSVMGQEM